MGLTLAKCPACGADLNLETDRDYFYCPHCGSKVLQQEDRIVIEHVSRTVDEAEVEKVKLQREKEQRSNRREETVHKIRIRTAKYAGILAAISFAVQSITPDGSNIHDASSVVLFFSVFVAIMSIVMAIMD